MSHGDKRSVVTDALETLGMIITEKEQRDAIHLAVEPVVAAHTLRPGDHVGFVAGGSRVGLVENPVGIVDPFLDRAVKANERFWLVVYPRQIQSLRHVWTHPAFDMPAEDQPKVTTPHPIWPTPISVSVAPSVGTKPDVSAPKTPSNLEREAQLWITDFARSERLSFDGIMDAAEGYLRDGDYLCDGGRWDGSHIPDEFWTHYEILTGKSIDSSERGSFFSCSC